MVSPPQPREHTKVRSNFEDCQSSHAPGLLSLTGANYVFALHLHHLSHPERSEGSVYFADSGTTQCVSKTLHIGVTSNLRRRVWQHKQGHGSDFCARYKTDRLVYYESFDEVIKAINREKQLKGLLRIKKIQLVVSMNPTWRDLSEGCYERHAYQPAERTDPSLRSG